MATQQKPRSARGVLLQLSAAEKRDLDKARVLCQNRPLDERNEGDPQPVTDAVNSKGKGNGADGLFAHLDVSNPKFSKLVRAYVGEVLAREEKWQAWTTDDEVCMSVCVIE